MMKRFPLYRQYDQTDCGPACLRMVSAFYGKAPELSALRSLSATSREGSSLFGLREAAGQIGFRTLALRLPYQAPSSEAPDLLSVPLPFIAHWEERHFFVVYKISRRKVWVADPAAGRRVLSRQQFEAGWADGEGMGRVLLLEPEPAFYQEDPEAREAPKGWGFLLRYFLPYRRQLRHLLLFLLFGSGIQLLFPFFTQAVVDIGIDNQDLSFIILLLIGQFMLFLSYLLSSAFQNWILLHLGARVNVAMIADYLGKLMKQPMRFFDQRHPGDLIQRISDHSRIEAFLTASTLSALFSLFTFLVFGIVLFLYKVEIFLIFLGGSLIYFAWILLFLKRRKQIDYQQFLHLSDHQNALLEIIQGMPDIKVQGNARQRKEKWMSIQGKLFFANLRQLMLTQYQEGGANLFNQIKDLLITFVAAAAVIRGELTLGMMLAIQYIVGQLNVPLQRILQFIQNAQDARLSLERLSEVHQEIPEKSGATAEEGSQISVPTKADIFVEQLSFRYGATEDWLLKEMDVHIPFGSLCALVGESGSGKTTLIRLLLGFYPAGEGKIRIGTRSLEQIPGEAWRRRCSVVFQDGFIFSDSIARNVSEGGGPYDPERLEWALEMAMLREWVESLPSGYNTRVGERGLRLSQGQKQRLLLARALYKPSDYLFLDEATNALDATNEKHILQNLRQLGRQRTIIVAAHRLSTIRQADMILVIDAGRIVEKGTHEELLAQKGFYHKLIQDQIS